MAVIFLLKFSARKVTASRGQFCSVRVGGFLTLVIALRSPATKRSSDLDRYSPDMHSKGGMTGSSDFACFAKGGGVPDNELTDYSVHSILLRRAVALCLPPSGPCALLAIRRGVACVSGNTKSHVLLRSRAALSPMRLR